MVLLYFCHLAFFFNVAIVADVVNGVDKFVPSFLLGLCVQLGAGDH